MSVVFNTIIIITIAKSETLRTPSYILLANACLTDLGTGLVSQPISIVGVIKASWFNVSCLDLKRQFSAAPIANFLFGVASLATSAAISIDRFLAIYLKNSYLFVVTKKRVFATIAAIWLYSLVTLTYDNKNLLPLYCILMATIIVSLVVVCVSYGKCFTAIRKHKQRIADTSNAATEDADLAKYRHAMITMVLTAAILFGVFFQHLGVTTVYTVLKKGKTEILTSLYELEVYRLSETIVYLNAVINPLLYLFRLRDISAACRRVI
ncbi:predicted protein, partial [Nematostella vectensis]